MATRLAPQLEGHGGGCLLPTCSLACMAGCWLPGSRQWVTGGQLAAGDRDVPAHSSTPLGTVPCPWGSPAAGGGQQVPPVPIPVPIPIPLPLIYGHGRTRLPPTAAIKGCAAAEGPAGERWEAASHLAQDPGWAQGDVGLEQRGPELLGPAVLPPGCPTAGCAVPLGDSPREVQGVALGSILHSDSA